MTGENDSHSEEEQPDRRQFIKGASCVIGAAIGAVPMAAGVRVALSPLMDKEAAEGGAMIRLGDLGGLETGVPMKFAIVADKSDKWTRYKDVPVGAVYLLKNEKDEVTAFNTVCPHLGCFVDYRKEESDFFCPCHDSNFALDGKLKNGVSPRGMDTLDVELRNTSEVWVKFQRFKANSKDKIAIS
ncbi:MAG: Rieske 2Fe-2S domain-containing protein [Verrucomicrobia subdivision 3 bacterium]|nr:Rieske 2Fe-2S domain-containing protein [Limisphaerales bacterium]